MTIGIAYARNGRSSCPARNTCRRHAACSHRWLAMRHSSRGRQPSCGLAISLLALAAINTSTADGSAEPIAGKAARSPQVFLMLANRCSLVTRPPCLLRLAWSPQRVVPAGIYFLVWRPSPAISRCSCHYQGGSVPASEQQDIPVEKPAHLRLQAALARSEKLTFMTATVQAFEHTQYYGSRRSLPLEAVAHRMESILSFRTGLNPPKLACRINTFVRCSSIVHILSKS
jgi:hypothetical protein